MKICRLLCLAIVPALLLAAGSPPDQKPDLKSLTTLFNNASDPCLGEAVVRYIDSGKTCLTLAPDLAGADAVLEIVLNSTPQDSGTNTAGAAGTLTLRSGKVIWSRSERVNIHAGFLGELVNRLLNRLSADAGCKTRAKSQ